MKEKNDDEIKLDHDYAIPWELKYLMTEDGQVDGELSLFNKAMVAGMVKLIQLAEERNQSVIAICSMLQGEDILVKKSDDGQKVPMFNKHEDTVPSRLLHELEIASNLVDTFLVQDDRGEP